MAVAGQAHALTTNLLVNFEGVLDGTNYTLGAREIDTTASFAANGSPSVGDGQAQLTGSGEFDVFADGFRFDPATIGMLAATNWMAEAVVAFDDFGLGLRTVIDVQGDTDFRISKDGGALEVGYWDGGKSSFTQAALPEVRSFIHLSLIWNAEASQLTAFTNGVPVGTVGDRPFVAQGEVSFGYLARKGIEGRGVDGLLHAVSFATSEHPISPSDFLINVLPPDPPPPPPPVLVDPRFPSEQTADLPEEWARWLPTRIRQLEAERAQLLDAISVLPQHHPISLSTRLGYHSRFEEAGSADALSPHQINIKWSWNPLLDSIALAPAFSPKKLEAYAFPKRFKIDVLNDETHEFETVVDWMDEDFPDPGLYPVFFAGINRYVTQVRITIPRSVRESGAAYDAIGEIYPLQQRPDGSTGANMAAWGRGHVWVEASAPLTMPPLWDVEYLNDSVVGLGFPLSDERFDSKDLMVVFDESDPREEVTLLLDLGRVVEIGRIDFWPSEAPFSLELPSFGFPGKIRVELSEYRDFRHPLKVDVIDDKGRANREGLTSVATQAFPGRYIRIRMGKLAEYKGKRILGLGEILVSEYEQALSVGCAISAKGLPDEYTEQLPRLVDGCSWGRRILPVGEWVKGLAQRRPLDRRLAVVERELERAGTDWHRIKQRLGIWSGIVVVLGLAGGLVFQRQLRKRGMNKLKWRIARDLHDDVGSNLGSISLTAEQLKHVVVEADVKEELCDLSLLAREACASLREVVWVIDENTIRLPALIEKLVERAERVLGGVELSVEHSEDCPDCVVSLTFKRHLIMFFKEAVHNCARHAQATRAWVAFSTGDQYLRISIRDNGCGFNPAEASDGWGLESMKERAEEMGGGLELDSRPGEGTKVALTVPLSALQGKTDHHYKTSN